MKNTSLIALLAVTPSLVCQPSLAIDSKKIPEIPENPAIVGQANASAFPINRGNLNLGEIWKTAKNTNPIKYERIEIEKLTKQAGIGTSAKKSKIDKTDDKIRLFDYERQVTEVVKILRDDGGHGSGFFFEYGGSNYVITNYHVVEGYAEVGIQFHPTAYDNLVDSTLPVHFGSVIIFDEIKDLAAIKLNDEMPETINLRGAQISAHFETTLKVGEDVHAIGHPFGEDWTYTRGYISQIRKQYGWNSGAIKHHVADVIQTQTPINVGNSGGPLYDFLGQVVGVTTFGKAEPGAEGVNFAIDVREVIDFLSKFETRKSPAISEDLALDLVGTKDENKNGIADLYYWDANKNSVIDAWGFDRNEDNYIEEIYFDGNENRKVEITGYLFQDKNGLFTRRGEWIFVYEHDENEDGEKDKVSIDLNLDGQIDLTM